MFKTQKSMHLQLTLKFYQALAAVAGQSPKVLSMTFCLDFRGNLSMSIQNTPL